MPQYRVLTGIDYPPDKRAEKDTLVSDIPEKSAKWLLEQGLIELSDGKTPKEEPVVEPVAEPVIEAAPEVTFDTHARDGDKDGYLQDGTEFQRPVEETN
jgi:hypothetical protein